MFYNLFPFSVSKSKNSLAGFFSVTPKVVNIPALEETRMGKCGEEQDDERVLKLEVTITY